jgi:hypothetical protein
VEFRRSAVPSRASIRLPGIRLRAVDVRAVLFAVHDMSFRHAPVARSGYVQMYGVV